MTAGHSYRALLIGVALVSTACASDCARSGCVSGVFISGSLTASLGSYRSNICVNNACNSATLNATAGKLDLNVISPLPPDTKIGDRVEIRYTVTESDGTVVFSSIQTTKVARVQGGCSEPDCAVVALQVDGDDLSILAVR